MWPTSKGGTWENTGYLITTYDVYRNEVLVSSDLSEDEYFDLMEDLAQEFYETGAPANKDLKTEMKES